LIDRFYVAHLITTCGERTEYCVQTIFYGPCAITTVSAFASTERGIAVAWEGFGFGGGGFVWGVGWVAVGWAVGVGVEESL